MRGIKRLLRATKKRVQSHGESYAISHNIGKIIRVSTEDILYKNVTNVELFRCDVVVRYLAIENYYSKNNFGFELYRKMQEKRIGKGYGEVALKKFKSLIRSYEEHGYDKDSSIILDKNLGLVDGSHRLALGLYHGIKTVNALVVNFDHPVDYSIDWFLSSGFTEDEIDIITSKANELLDVHNAPFSCVIWSPAISMANEIIKDLSRYGVIESVHRYSFGNVEEYGNIVRAIYAIDDIEKWKIDKKLKHMNGYTPELFSIDLRITEPDYRVKSATKKPLSRKVERIKKAIRERYKDYIKDYFFDIILHIADNHLQSDYMRKVFEPNIDLKELFELLNPYSYALLKDEAPNMPKSFPDVIPVGKDIDIICTRDEFPKVREVLKQITEKYKEEYDIRIVDKEYGTLFRFEFDSRLIFLADLSWLIFPGLNDRYVIDAIKSRISHKGYYKVNPKYEYLSRCVTYIENNKKFIISII